MTTLTLGVDDWQTLGAEPVCGGLVEFEPVRAQLGGERALAARPWRVRLDAEGSASVELPPLDDGNGVGFRPQFRGLPAFTFTGYGAADTITLAEAYSVYRVDPATLEPSPPAPEAWWIALADRPTREELDEAVADRPTRGEVEAAIAEQLDALTPESIGAQPAGDYAPADHPGLVTTAIVNEPFTVAGLTVGAGGSAVATYRRVGATVVYAAYIGLGPGFVMPGNFIIPLPAEYPLAQSRGGRTAFALCTLIDASTGGDYVAFVCGSGGTTSIRIRAAGPGLSMVSMTDGPFEWEVGDIISLSVDYPIDLDRLAAQAVLRRSVDQDRVDDVPVGDLSLRVGEGRTIV